VRSPLGRTYPIDVAEANGKHQRGVEAAQLRQRYITRGDLNGEHICAQICSVIYRQGIGDSAGGGTLMRQREWVASTFGDCPVREEVIGLLYRSSQHHIQEFISGLSPQHRASLAAFCYGRAHLHDVGLTIAATCEFEELVAAAGSVGHFLFEQSRELSSEGKPISFSKQMDVSLARRAPAP
jgi:hypothetical protein